MGIILNNVSNYVHSMAGLHLVVGYGGRTEQADADVSCQPKVVGEILFH